jgi:tRNA (cmo5U34)-methyltransferase
MVTVAEQFHFDPDTYLDMVRSEVPDYDVLQRIITEAARQVEARTILDLGTGTGETLRHIGDCHPTAQLIGIDESDRMLAVARGHVPNADLRLARLQDELPVGPFDLVVSALAVHHLNAHEKADLFQRVAARLAPGGRFVLGDVVAPDDPADAVTPLHPGYDQPSRVDEQLQWLNDAMLDATLQWNERDLAVLIADRR